jgi:transposase
MEMLYSRCCGLDVHAKTVVACLCVEGEKQIRTFSTMTADLLQLADWLLAAGLQSTGRPLYRPISQRPPHQSGARTED